MIKRMVIMLVAVAVVFGGIFGFQAFKAAMIKKFITALSNPPQTISAATAATSEWQPKIEAIGSLRAVRGADSVARSSPAWSSRSPSIPATMSRKARRFSSCAPPTTSPGLKSLEAMAELNEITLDRAQRLYEDAGVSQAQSTPTPPI